MGWKRTDWKKIAATTSVALLPLLSLQADLAAAEIIPDLCKLQIRTPALAEQKIRKLRLDNGLEAYLISSPLADESAAALVIDVGSWQDSPSRPGIAHFTEHMLFLGNATYPQEEGFHRFVDDHGGKTNAYTADERTAYIFSIQNDHFKEALCRFSHFFIDPLLSEGSMAREMCAVDKECSRAAENNGWREVMVIKACADPSHPFARFSAGNLETLQGISHEEERAWFESHYSSNLMHLAIVSPLPLDEIEALVCQEFEAIPNRGFTPFSAGGPLLSSATLGKILYIQPHQDVRRLSLLWELPYNYSKDLETHAANLIASVLGDEGKGSLLEELKREGLADGITADLNGMRRPTSSTFLLSLDIDLTPAGLKAKERVIKTAFQAIASLKESGIPTYIREERNQMARLAYEYQTRVSAYQAAYTLTELLTNEPLTTFPQKSLLSSRFDERAVGELLSLLRQESCHIHITAPESETGIHFTQEEPWMHVGYASQPVAKEQQVSWAATQPHPTIKIPSPNPFLPRNLDIFYCGEPLAYLPTPERLSSDGFGTLYLARDEHFLLPEISWTFNIKSATLRPGNPEDAVLLDLWIRSISEHLNPIAHAAAKSGLHYELKPSPFGITLAVCGYSDKAELLLDQILSAISTASPAREAFLRYCDSLKRSYQNFSKSEPVLQASALAKEILLKEYVSNADKALALRSIELTDLNEFAKDFCEETYIEGFLFGNMNLTKAHAVQRSLRERFQHGPFPEGRYLRAEVVTLPNEEGPFFISKAIKSQGNAAFLTIQHGPFTLKRRAAHQILATGLQEPFFSELRTKQQTGYVVASGDQELEKQLFTYFCVESTSHDGRELLSRFELFLEDFLRDLPTATFPEERFDAIKTSFLAKLKQLPKNPIEMGLLLHNLAFTQNGNFKWIQERIKATEELTYSEFTAIALDFLGRNNRQRLAVLAVGKLPKERTLAYSRVRSINRLKEISSYSRAPREEIGDLASNH